MKKAFIILLAAALVFSAIACNNARSSGSDISEQKGDAQAPNGLAAPSEGSNAALSGELLPGMVTVFGNEGGFKMKGVRFSAERTGNPGGINNWESSLTMIRTVFELDEWIAYTLEYEYGSEYAKLGVWLLPHRDLSEYTNISEMADVAFFCEYELPYETYPHPLDDLLMLQTGVNAGGDYDMLFTLNGKPIAGTLLRFVEAGALDGLSDEQIASMMAVG